MKNNANMIYFLIMLVLIVECEAMWNYRPLKKKGHKGKVTKSKTKKINSTIAKNKTKEIKMNNQTEIVKGNRTSSNTTKVNETKTNNETKLNVNKGLNMNETISNHTTNNTVIENKTNSTNETIAMNNSTNNETKQEGNKEEYNELEQFFSTLQNHNKKKEIIAQLTKNKIYNISQSFNSLKQSMNNITSNYLPLISNISDSLSLITFNNENAISLLKKTKIDLQKKLSQSKEDISSRMNSFILYDNKTLLESECENRNSCSTCLENQKCIWCNSLHTCLLGDSNGDYYNKCNNDFSSTKCESINGNCDKYKTCSECLINPLCGWCGESNTCTQGNSNSAIGYQCNSTLYYHLYGKNSKC